MRTRMRTNGKTGGALGLLVGAALGCGGAEDASAPVELDRPPRSRSVEEEEDLSVYDTMAGLGYVDFDDEPADPELDGLVLLDPDAHRGYTLITSIPHGRADLLSATGEVVRSWTTSSETRLTRSELLPNGDVLAIGYEPGPFLVRWNWDGEVVWKLEDSVHHDLDPLPDGRILALGARRRLVPDLHPEIELSDHLLVLVTSDGEVVEKRSIYDMLTAAPSVQLKEATLPTEEPWVLDLIHANSVHWIDRPELAAEDPLYASGNVVVCMREQDAIAIFDWEASRVVWMWGAGELQRPHEASVLENGNILTFDNGTERGSSRIVEVDPRRNEIVWEYETERPKNFFSPGRGTVELLSNGNVLVGYSIRGSTFEVTRDGRKLWRYLNPHKDVEGHRGSIRAQRYDPKMVKKILRRKGR